MDRQAGDRGPGQAGPDRPLPLLGSSLEVNTAAIVGSDLYDPDTSDNSASAAIMVGGYRLYLPLVVRNN